MNFSLSEPRDGMTKEEVSAGLFVSFGDDDLKLQIECAERDKAEGYRPEMLDILKRGHNPKYCDEMIADYTFELERRARNRSAIIPGVHAYPMPKAQGQSPKKPWWRRWL